MRCDDPVGPHHGTRARGANALDPWWIGPWLVPWSAGNHDRAQGCMSGGKEPWNLPLDMDVHGGRLALCEDDVGQVLAYAPGGGCHCPALGGGGQLVVPVPPTPSACQCQQ